MNTLNQTPSGHMKKMVMDADNGFTSEDIPDFDLPVDSEHKAKALKVYSFKRPHMRAFHLNWMSFFTSFFATFAAAPLLPIIREDLNLTKTDIANAGIAAVTGAVFARIVMGTFCDTFGPRYGMSCLMLLVSPAVFLMSMVVDATGFIIVRLVIGFSLATFVACQFWTSVMFSPNVVGLANAAAGGWGNMGGGATQLVMPYLATAIAKHTSDFLAWRWAFFLPGAMFVVVSTLVLFFAQDLPDGNYNDLQKAGKKDKAKGYAELFNALKNYRTWVILCLYGYCFGVELTIDNVAAQYFYDNFDLSLTAAGNLAAIFGLFNIASRLTGGLMSDLAAKPFGMRGRLWWGWFIQTTGGVLCIVLGLMHNNLTNTIVVLCFFSYFLQASCGAVFGVVPFVSRRSLGVVSGLVGAGGNAHSAIMQAIFFGPHTTLAVYKGIIYTGIVTVCVTQLYFLIYFPQWGGMVLPARKGASEEEYYYAEYTAAEKEQGKHLASSKFAHESKSQRGIRRLQTEAALEHDKVTEMVDTKV